METILGWVEAYRYGAIFFLLTLGIIGLPIPDEGVLAFAGYLAYKGDLRLLPTIIASFLGSACGITFSYGVGRTGGDYLVRKYGPLVGLTAQKLAWALDWFNRAGRWGLLFGYFLPGVRHLTAFVAGLSNLPLAVFARFAYTGSVLWSGTFVITGFYLGEGWTRVTEEIRPALIAASCVIGGALFVWVLLQYTKHDR